MAQPTRKIHPAPGCAHACARSAQRTLNEHAQVSRCRSALGRAGGTVGRLAVLSRQKRYCPARIGTVGNYAIYIYCSRIADNPRAPKLMILFNRNAQMAAWALVGGARKYAGTAVQVMPACTKRGIKRTIKTHFN